MKNEVCLEPRETWRGGGGRGGGKGCLGQLWGEITCCQDEVKVQQPYLKIAAALLKIEVVENVWWNFVGTSVSFPFPPFFLLSFSLPCVLILLIVQNLRTFSDSLKSLYGNCYKFGREGRCQLIKASMEY